MTVWGGSGRVATVAIVVVAPLGTLPGIGAPSAYAATTTNLIKNPGAEKGAGAGDASTVVPVPGWTVDYGTTFTAVQWAAGGGFPVASDPGPKNRGLNFFAGGPGDEEVQVSQTHSLKPYATAIAGGGVGFNASAFLGGYLSQNDQATVNIYFIGRHGSVLQSATLGPVTAADRNNVTGLLKRTASGAVPVGSLRVLVQLYVLRTDGTYNDGYADGLSLTLGGV